MSGNVVGYTEDGRVFLILHVKLEEKMMQTMFTYTVEEASIFSDSLRGAAEQADTIRRRNGNAIQKQAADEGSLRGPFGAGDESQGETMGNRDTEN